MLVDFVEAEKAKSARADDKWQGEVSCTDPHSQRRGRMKVVM